MGTATGGVHVIRMSANEREVQYLGDSGADTRAKAWVNTKMTCQMDDTLVSAASLDESKTQIETAVTNLIAGTYGSNVPAVRADRIVIVGFSMGAAMATHMGLSLNSQIAGVVAFAG